MRMRTAGVRALVAVLAACGDAASEEGLRARFDMPAALEVHKTRQLKIALENPGMLPLAVLDLVIVTDRKLFNDQNPVLSLGDRVPPAILERKREILRKYGLELVPKGTAHHVAITPANFAAAMNAFEECRAIK